jgi:hypothetical protein
LGLCTFRQRFPFHDKISVCVLLLKTRVPTALQAEGLAHETATMGSPTAWRTFGLGTMVQFAGV